MLQYLAFFARFDPTGFISFKLLLEAGTDINALELNGKTVLHLAGTRLRYLLSDDNDKVSPKLKCEAIMVSYTAQLPTTHK